ncbi:MAG: helix-turn-helix transcriptional regulator [Sedimenticola sp.]
MNSHAQVQIIERDGRPEYAVVPFDDYKRLLALAEDAEEIWAYDKAMHELDHGEDELIPSGVVEQLLAGEHPLKVWREYRSLTQKALADQAEVTKSYISQIETGNKIGSLALLKRLASALNVEVDDLMTKGG